ncbi:TIGR03621 family F420-dependent LLM class oxidoreductase [bacterium]|nr:TIGR03621 family F420-dependent LLM class oxidoreductase [bacterium]
MKKFRFGVMCRGTNIAQVARRAETLGYTSISMPDHFGDQWAPGPAMAAAATATSVLRLAPLVWCNDFRHPVVLAKEVATLDLLSGGRMELGLGAGWMKSDYEESGMCMDSAGVRIERMAEALQVLRALLGPNRCVVSGKYYQVDMNGLPKPIQSPVPIFVGGGGQKMLSLAGREADIVGINVNLRSGLYKDIAENFSARACDEKIGWVRAPGRDVELNILVGSVAVGEREPALQRFSEEMETPLEILRDSPHVLAGSVSELSESLVVRRQRWGFSYIVVREEAMEVFAPVVAQLHGA